ncbi:MAG: hypothetical protein ACI8SJ_001423, partial [Shewanella sp.]
ALPPTPSVSYCSDVSRKHRYRMTVLTVTDRIETILSK